MSEYKEELSALVERIKQYGAKEERRRIALLLEGEDFCIVKKECSSTDRGTCCRCIYEWLGGGKN